MPWGTPVAAILLLSAPAARADELTSLARELASAARHEGLTRVAVLPFVPVDQSPASDGWALAERFTTPFVSAGKVRAVERALLSKVLDEISLSRTGLLGNADAPARLTLADGVIAGSFAADGDRVALNVRLISRETGAVLAAGAATLKRGRATAAADPAMLSGMAMAAEELEMEDCSGAAQRVDRLERSVMDLEARYWAIHLRQGLSFADLRRVPGADISDQDQRWDFYDQVRVYYAARELPALTRTETAYLALIEKVSARVRDRCAEKAVF